MKNAVLYLSALMVLSFSVHVGATEPPIFTGCPQSVSGSHCDSIFFQVVAVDPETYNACADIRYHLVSGPGTVNELTGLWVFHPTAGDAAKQHEVEISASYGDTMTLGAENCHFPVHVKDDGPTFVEGCENRYYLLAPDTVVAQVTAVDYDPCDPIFYTLWSVEPDPIGTVWIDSLTGEVTFAADYQDGGQTFEVTIGVPGHRRVYLCDLYFETQWAVVGDTIAISIEKLENQVDRHATDVEIFLDQSSHELGGFNLLLAYDTAQLTFLRAFPGSDFYDEGCQWEYFTYRTTAGIPCDSGCPSGMVRIFGMADTHDSPVFPLCHTPDPLPASLARLRFFIHDTDSLDCVFFPIRFFWIDCGDNTLSDVNGKELFLSKSVVDHDGAPMPLDTILPTFAGSPPICIDSINPARTNVIYHNGGIEVGCFSVDVTGDINLNALPYEFSDAIMFADYYIYGLGAFGDHPDGSTAASDVTYDGVPLTLEDFVYLVRVVLGDAAPRDSEHPLLDTSQHAARFAVETGSSVVTVDTPDSLGAVQLIFRGEVTPVLVQTDMEMMSHFDGEMTRVFIYSLGWGEFISNGPLIAFVGDGILEEAHTATYFGHRVNSEVDSQLGSIRLRIEKHDWQIQGSYAEVDILLEKGTVELGGFDLYVSTDPRALTLETVEPGMEFYDDCGWEYFTYRAMSLEDSCGGFCPSGKVRILGIADGNETPTLPDCYLPDTLPARLATMRFLVSDKPAQVCQFVPIRFYWTDCADNSLSNVAGTELYASKNVFTSNGINITGGDSFPSYQGALPECAFNYYPFLTEIDFFNGSVQIACVDSSTCRPGDINGNYTSFDVSDYSLYQQYFFHGWGIFANRDSICVLNAMDVNGDGISPSVEDLRYLFFKVIGGELPDPPVEPSPNTAYFHQHVSNQIVSFETPDSLGAVYMVFDGEIQLSLMSDPARQYMGLLYFWDGEKTRALIDAYSAHHGDYITSGPLVIYTGEGVLEEVYAATFDARHVNTVIDHITDVGEDRFAALPLDFVLSQNYPNPFNPVTVIEFGLPYASDIEIVIYNVTGQVVKTLVKGTMPAGYHYIEWNGTDQSGQSVASGLYLYRITAGEFTQSRKMLFLK